MNGVDDVCICLCADIWTPNAVAFAGGALFVMGVWEGVWRFDNADAYALAGVSFAQGKYQSQYSSLSLTFTLQVNSFRSCAHISGNGQLPAMTGVNIIKGWNLPDAFNPYPQHRWKYIAINAENHL